MINQNNRRYIWWFATVGLIALGVTLLWNFQYPDTPELEIEGVSELVTSNEKQDPESFKTAAAKSTESLSDLTALEHYKQSTRYPPTTRSLNEDSFDLLNPGARHEQRHALPGDENNPDMAWQVLFTADRFFVSEKEPLLISLQLWNMGQATLPADVSMSAEALGVGADPVPITLKLQTDGRARTAVFQPNEHWPDYVGQVKVVAKFSAEGLQPQTGSLDFYFTATKRIPARFTGKFRDHLNDGDLLIDVGLRVESGGIYRVDGNLFDQSGKPFGWARFEGELTPGDSVATLRYYGLLFHDAALKGPYVLKNLHGYRLRPGDTPHREDIPKLASEYQTTGHYSLDNFRAEVNNSPRRQRMIEMYEDAERRGVKLTRPEYTGDNP